MTQTIQQIIKDLESGESRVIYFSRIENESSQ